MSAIGPLNSTPPALSLENISSVHGVLRHRWNVLVALALPLLLEASLRYPCPRLVYLTEMNVGQTFDQTITATAQPHIASSFNRLDLQAWIGTSFILTVTAFLPLFANIADVFGRFWAL